jgi:hypothetical protein
MLHANDLEIAFLKNLSEKTRSLRIVLRIFFRVGWCADRNIQKFRNSIANFHLFLRQSGILPLADKRLRTWEGKHQSQPGRLRYFLNRMPSHPAK